jgi:hypothetical protein
VAVVVVGAAVVVVVVVVGAVVVVVVGVVVVVVEEAGAAVVEVDVSTFIGAAVEMVVIGGVASPSESPHPAARRTRTAGSEATRSETTCASSRQSTRSTRPRD